ncbi:MAG: DUF3168 domain-containing protein [Silicimonas sp.]|nr:DUF3168 domain-containing protein [Silicimonas sp.]NNL35604.1 DUF3168 domain-containing protein [Silicimonas sp.]NNL74673.1 DUF3168 domain-containing protein [Silicimonas sp.]
MSYAVSAALQAAVYQSLVGDSELATLTGGAIHDQMPPGPVDGTFVSFGPETVRDRSDKTHSGAEHRLTVSVISDAAGFQTAKIAAGRINDILVDATPALARGRIVSLRFVSARARRVRAGQTRRIDLSFRAIVEDT